MAFERKILCILMASSALFTGNSFADEVIVNGGFEVDTEETNSPFGWNVAEIGVLGSVISTSANVSPISGYDTAGAASGNNYALLDSFAPSTQVLYQAFTIGAVSSATLSFNWFYSDQSGGGVVFNEEAGLDYTSGGTFDANQHWRVDILRSESEIFSTDSLDTLFTTGHFFPSGPTYVSGQFDIMGGLNPNGGTYVLRFANVGNQGAAQFGIDNVSLQVTPVPEADTSAMLLAGLGVIGFVARRRKAV